MTNEQLAKLFELYKVRYMQDIGLVQDTSTALGELIERISDEAIKSINTIGKSGDAFLLSRPLRRQR